MGSGNTSKNDWPYTKRMIDELKAVDTGKHDVVIKWQLFKEAGQNIPLDREIFSKAHKYAKELGYKTTSSVFDKESLDFLLQFEVPFAKIANNRKLDWLIGEIPRKVPVYVSYGSYEEMKSNKPIMSDTIPLRCLSQYPASLDDYVEVVENWFCGPDQLAISDHTTNFGLWYRYQPKIIEWHYVLKHDPNNLDGGPFARTPEQLREVL